MTAQRRARSVHLQFFGRQSVPHSFPFGVIGGRKRAISASVGGLHALSGAKCEGQIRSAGLANGRMRCAALLELTFD